MKQNYNAVTCTAARRPRLIDPTQIEETEVQWLWPEKFPLGMLSLISGDAGLGKSFMTCLMAAKVTTGGDWPDGTKCRKGSVLFFVGEDRIKNMCIKRLRANGADLSMIRFLDGAEFVTDGLEAVFSLADIDIIEAAIQQTEQATGYSVIMVVIDPISDFWGRINENSNASVRAVLRPLSRLAERTEAAFVMIQHNGKAAKEFAKHKIIGSVGIVAACRAVWLVVPEDDKVRVMAPAKINCSSNPSAVSFRIVDGKVEIIDANIDKSADQILAELKQNCTSTAGRPPEEVRKAEEWLASFLSDGRKPVGSKNPVVGTVCYEAAVAGHSWGTVRRAADNICVIKEQENGGYYWRLPVAQNEVAQNDILRNLDDPADPENTVAQNEVAHNCILSNLNSPIVLESSVEQNVAAHSTTPT